MVGSKVIVICPDAYSNSPYMISAAPIYQSNSSNEIIGYVYIGQALICEYNYYGKRVHILDVIHNISSEHDEDEWMRDYDERLNSIINGYIDKIFVFELKEDNEYCSSLDKLREMVYDIYSRLRFGKALENPDEYRTYEKKSGAINNNHGNQYGYDSVSALVPPSAFVKKINAKVIMALPQTISENISNIHTVSVPIKGDSYEQDVSATVYGQMTIVLAYLEKSMVDVSKIITTKYIQVPYDGNYKEVYPSDITNSIYSENYLPENSPFPEEDQALTIATKFTLSWDDEKFANDDVLKIYYRYEEEAIVIIGQ